MSYSRVSSICPQCGTGYGVFDWTDIFLMQCKHCGLFVDIREMDAETNYDDTCPSCAIEAIKRAGLWKPECSIPGLGVYCSDGCVEFIDDVYDSYDEAVEEFDRAVLAQEIDTHVAYITKADGAKVEFLRGSFQNVINNQEDTFKKFNKRRLEREKAKKLAKKLRKE